MSYSWEDFSNALADISVRTENSLSEQHATPMDTGCSKAKLLTKSLKATMRKQEMNFHPKDVLLGKVPRMSHRFFRGTAPFYEKIRAFHRSQNGDGAQGKKTDTPFTTLVSRDAAEEHVDQLMESVWNEGGRFVKFHKKQCESTSGGETRVEFEIHIIDMTQAREAILGLLRQGHRQVDRIVLDAQRMRTMRKRKAEKRVTSKRPPTPIPASKKARTQRPVKQSAIKVRKATPARPKRSKARRARK